MRRMAVLQEDDYASGLAAVIQRDYFPQLPALRAASGDMEAQRQPTPLTRKRSRGGNGADEAANDEEMVEQEEPLPGVESVDSFLSTYTSEDNASFTQLQKEELEQRRAKDVWGQRMREQQRKETEKKLLLLEGPGGAKNAVLPMLEASAPMDPNKQLMGLPRTDTVYHNQLVVAEAKAHERVIDAENSRLDDATIIRVSSVPPAVDPEGKRKKLGELVTRNVVLAGKAKGLVHVDLDDFYDEAKDSTALEQEPTVAGYTFVSAPKIVPGQGVDASPIVSWGTVASTPVLVNVSRGRQFMIPEDSERERVALKLADGGAEKAKRRAQATPVFGSTPRMTPAAAVVTGTGTTPIFSPAGQKLLEEQMRGRRQAPSLFKTPTFKTPNTVPANTRLEKKFATPNAPSGASRPK